MRIGYCTNVHAGGDLATTRAQLEKHALAVRDQVTGSNPMGIGLWLSAKTAEELSAPGATAEFADWLAAERLIPFTLNGFPFGDFHQSVVKHKVYEPTWADQRRSDYTLRLASCLDQLLPSGIAGSISTLPLGWRDCLSDPKFAQLCANELKRVAAGLDELAQRTGREIVIGLEPEPGCAFDTADGIAQFFDQYLAGESSQEHQRLRRHLGVCHDICHSAVMRESQADAFRTYADHALRVAKIQVSSAIRLRLDLQEPESRQALDQLRGFAEDRYLHQTTVAIEGGAVSFYEDLPLALADIQSPESPQEWRIHFHVPIHHDRLGWISSTNDEIRQCLAALADLKVEVDHFEVETYAWNVLPSAHRWETLAAGIAAEMTWFRQLIDRPFPSGT